MSLTSSDHPEQVGKVVLQQRSCVSLLQYPSSIIVGRPSWVLPTCAQCAKTVTNNLRAAVVVFTSMSSCTKVCLQSRTACQACLPNTPTNIRTFVFSRAVCWGNSSCSTLSVSFHLHVCKRTEPTPNHDSQLARAGLLRRSACIRS